VSVTTRRVLGSTLGIRGAVGRARSAWLRPRLVRGRLLRPLQWRWPIHRGAVPDRGRSASITTGG